MDLKRLESLNDNYIPIDREIRERQGVFFTPLKCVELAHDYLRRILGEEWQSNYYVWDCAAGTGNLLMGLSDSEKVWASTLSLMDVDCMHEAISHGANLLHDHIFQFDFLNDDFIPISQGGKLPDALYNIISDEHKRKCLIVLINPPFAEATNARARAKKGGNKPGVSNSNRTHHKYKKIIGHAAKELFALFMFRIYKELNGCILAIFSTPKFIVSPNFRQFRNHFSARFLGGFVVPSYTFNDVKGHFPITFTVWNTGTHDHIDNIILDVYDDNFILIGHKKFRNIDHPTINIWFSQYKEIDKNNIIGFISYRGTNFQSQDKIFITNDFNSIGSNTVGHINTINLLPSALYFAVRQCIKDNWLIHDDQFYYPDHGWQDDREFMAAALIFTLFHNKNRVTSKVGHNHWIPFPEELAGVKGRYKYRTIIDFLNGNIDTDNNIFPIKSFRILDYLISEAKLVYEAGLKLWRYYHSYNDANVDASFYDIKEYFKGRTLDGRLKQNSTDTMFNHLMYDLRKAMDALSLRIAEKAYKYGFLRQ